MPSFRLSPPAKGNLGWYHTYNCLRLIVVWPDIECGHRRQVPPNLMHILHSSTSCFPPYVHVCVSLLSEEKHCRITALINNAQRCCRRRSIITPLCIPLVENPLSSRFWRDIPPCAGILSQASTCHGLSDWPTPLGGSLGRWRCLTWRLLVVQQQNGVGWAEREGGERL